MHGALHLARKWGGALLQLLDDGYTIECTGHSMGAGISALLALLLRLMGLPAHAVCFATPAVMDHELARACRPYVLSVVNTEDIVPRASVFNLSVYSFSLAKLPWRAILSGPLKKRILDAYKSVKSGILGDDGKAREIVNWSSEMQQSMPNTLQEWLKAQGSRSDFTASDAVDKKQLVPGSIIYLKRMKDANGKDGIVPWSIPNLHFELLCFIDENEANWIKMHLCDAYAKSLDAVDMSKCPAVACGNVEELQMNDTYLAALYNGTLIQSNRLSAEVVPLTASELKVHQQDFHKFDVDGSGLLEEAEIAKLIAFQLGAPPSDDDLKCALRDMDRDGDGKISFDEYMKAVCVREPKKSTISKPRKPRRGGGSRKK